VAGGNSVGGDELRNSGNAAEANADGCLRRILLKDAVLTDVETVIPADHNFDARFELR